MSEWPSLVGSHNRPHFTFVGVSLVFSYLELVTVANTDEISVFHAVLMKNAAVFAPNPELSPKCFVLV